MCCGYQLAWEIVNQLCCSYQINVIFNHNLASAFLLLRCLASTRDDSRWERQSHGKAANVRPHLTSTLPSASLFKLRMEQKNKWKEIWFIIGAQQRAIKWTIGIGRVIVFGIRTSRNYPSSIDSQLKTSIPKRMMIIEQFSLKSEAIVMCSTLARVGDQREARARSPLKWLMIGESSLRGLSRER